MPVAFTKKCSRNVSEIDSQNIHRRGLAGIVARGGFDEGPKRLAIRALNQQVHEDLGETVAQFVRIAGLVKGSAGPKGLDVFRVPKGKVALGEFMPHNGRTPRLCWSDRLFKR